MLLSAYETVRLVSKKVVWRSIRRELTRRLGAWNTVDILCYFNPVHKIESGLEHLPSFRFQPLPVTGPLIPRARSSS